MGASEMMFVGFYTVLCLGASMVVSRKYVKDKLEYYNGMLDQVEKENRYYKGMLFSNDQKISSYTAEITRLKNYIAQIQRERQKSSHNGSQNSNSYTESENELIVKALKKAMFDSHPDRGGKTEEFIQYNTLYKKLK